MRLPLPSPRRLTAAAGLGLVAAVALAGPASAAAPGPAAAASWLSGALTDGDHVVIGGFAYDGTSADTVYALAAAGGQETTVAAVDAYLQANVVNYADPEGTGQFPGPYSGSLAKLSLVAEVLGEDPHAYGGSDLLKVLVDNTCTAPNAAGTCTAPGEFYQSFSTISQALGVIALQRSPVAADRLTAASAPVTRLLALRCADGLFTGTLLAPGATCATGEVDSTAYAAQALGAVLGADDAVVTSTLDALAAAQDASGGFAGAAGVNTNGTGVALSAFSLLSARYAATITRGVAFVEGLQRTDGAYPVSATDASDGSALQATPQALLGVLGQNLVTVVPAVAPPTTPPTTTAPTPVGGTSAPVTGSAPELAATGVAQGRVGGQLALGLGALVLGAAAVRFGARRLPAARHRS